MASLVPSPRFIRRLIAHETSGGFLLIVSALVALAIANSPWNGAYFGALEARLGGLTVLHWVNDALMAVFFLVVGLEIKRELIDGELSDWDARAVPSVAALGGMIAPALIYAAINWSTPETLRGWAIPSATDIAFSLAVLALFGKSIPLALKVFLTALAILDDLGAIIIIAVFYTGSLSWPMLGAAVVVLTVLFGINRAGVRNLASYLALGGLLWFFTLKSGVHATVAGVALAMTIPLNTDQRQSPLHRLESALQPWSSYLVLPLFGFANAGVSLAGIGLRDLAQPVTLGVMLGLFAGKQIGVFGSLWLMTRLGIGRAPSGASWLQTYGVALLCGVGFTMSLFIGLLAFERTPELETSMKLGVLLGSLLSIVAGSLVLTVARIRYNAAAR